MSIAFAAFATAPRRTGSIPGLACPDGVRRRFVIAGYREDGTYRGHVWVAHQGRRYAVSGYAVPVGRDARRRQAPAYAFYPKRDGKHFALVLPRPHKPGTVVRIVDPRSRYYGHTGKVVEFSGYDYTRPVYLVHIYGRGRGNHRPVVLKGNRNVEAVEAA